MVQLVGREGYEIEIDGDAPQVQKLLQVLPGVCLVEIVPTEALPPNRSLIRITTAPEAEPGRDIAAVVVGAGVGLHEMRRTHATLEDVFLRLTTQEPVAEAEEPLPQQDTSAVPGGNA
jgi:ABC-2 type transport system ATP-binding protein